MADVAHINQPNTLTEEQLDQLQFSLFQIFGDKEKISNFLRSDIGNILSWDEHTIQQIYSTTWRQIVDISFKNILYIKRENIPSMLQRMTVTAFLLGIDVEEQLFYYFHRVLISKDIQQGVYDEIREALMDDAAQLSYFTPDGYSLHQFYTEFSNPKIQNDSIARAEFLVKIDTELFGEKNVFEDIDLNEEDIVNRLYYFLVFFFEKRNVSEIIDEYYRRVDEEVQKEFAIEYIENMQTEAALGLLGVDVSTEEIEPNQATNSYESIKSEIEASFGTIETYPVERIGEVLAVLQEESTELSDPNVNALIIYNESTGTFEWNNELLAS